MRVTNCGRNRRNQTRTKNTIGHRGIPTRLSQTALKDRSAYEAWLSSLPQLLPNPKRIAPQIQNGINVDHVVIHFIIDAEWEALRQHSMESKIDWMNAGKKKLESQDRRGLSRENNRQLPSRTTYRIAHLTRGLLPRPRVLPRSSFRIS